jgi:hypothetical protein
MSNHTFSRDEIKQLTSNPFVRKVTKRTVIYTPDFKKFALDQHAKGMSYKEIFRQAGLCVSDRNESYTKGCIKRWKNIMTRKGLAGLTELQGSQGGRPKTKGLTDADKINRLELQVKYLEAANDFLVKLRDKRAESNSVHIKNSTSSSK